MLHSELIRETGGVDGLRDEGLLDSALNAPFQGFGDTDTFPSLQQKGARLGYGLICNHAFVDGNKRIGALNSNIHKKNCPIWFLTLRRAHCSSKTC